MPASRIEADYLVETALDPRRAAEVIAGEQSSGTFRPVPGETEALKARAAARVERLEVVGEAEAPSLPGALHPPGAPIRRVALTLSWPLETVGPSLTTLVATVAGNLFELREVSGLRLLDLRLPDAFAAAYSGPRFGVEGTRRLSGVARGPLIGTIVKPSVGLGPEETAELVDGLARAGIDFVKDDELQCDGPACPFEERARAVLGALRDHAEHTGKRVMYAPNLTGEVDEMRRRHDLVRDLGGTCVMVSLNAVGLAGFLALARHAELPIHAHRNGWGALSRAPALGWSYVAWQKPWRLAGADHMHVNGLSNKFAEDDESVVTSARACLAPMFEGHPCVAMPVFSSGQTPLEAPETFARLGSADLIHAAGGGIMAHPGGPAAGVEAFRDAWGAAMAGQPLEHRARDRPALAEAMRAFAR